MQENKVQIAKQLSKTQQTALVAVVTAMYIAITMLVQPLAYGQVQMRLSEMFNHLVVFNKRYIWALTAGVFIVNIWSPLGAVDMVVGTLQTLVMTSIVYLITRKIESIKVRLAISTIFDVFMMWIIAAELHFVLHTPFWITYGWTAVGELISLVIGAILFYWISKYIDLES